jgi:hypothetical protein
MRVLQLARVPDVPDTLVPCIRQSPPGARGDMVRAFERPTRFWQNGPAAITDRDRFMIVQTNSYIVPLEKREAHARLMRRFRQAMLRLGCDHFEVHEQVGSHWTPQRGAGRFLQILRFRDRQHYQAVQAAERGDPAVQALIREFADLIGLAEQQQQGTFSIDYYASIPGADGLAADPARPDEAERPGETAGPQAPGDKSAPSPG